MAPISGKEFGYLGYKTVWEQAVFIGSAFN